MISGTWLIFPVMDMQKCLPELRDQWTKTAREYILKRENLVCLFVLIDSRHKPQKSDIEFMEFLGKNQVPFARVFTKSDKLNQAALEKINAAI